MIEPCDRCFGTGYIPSETCDTCVDCQDMCPKCNGKKILSYSMNKTKMNQVVQQQIVELVTVLQGVKRNRLILDLAAEFQSLTNAEIIDEIDHAVSSHLVTELTCLLPDNKVVTFYLPKGTQVKING